MFRLPIRLAGDETAFPAKNRAVLKDVKIEMPGEFVGANGIHSFASIHVAKSAGLANRERKVLGSQVHLAFYSGLVSFSNMPHWNADFPIGTPGRKPALLSRSLRLPSSHCFDATSCVETIGVH